MTVLVDTSVWIDHFRNGNRQLEERLQAGQVACHPFVIGELACGNLDNRDEILTLLAALPQTILVHHEEALQFVSAHRLAGKRLGWMDIHLLASAKLTPCPIWTLDRALQAAANELKLTLA